MKRERKECEFHCVFSMFECFASEIYGRHVRDILRQKMVFLHKYVPVQSKKTILLNKPVRIMIDRKIIHTIIKVGGKLGLMNITHEY